MAKPRQIVEEHAVSAALEAAREKFPRLEEVWLGWTWRLVRNPLIEAVPVPGSKPQAYIVKSPDFGHYEGLPSALVILFVLPNDEQIQFLQVWAD